ncbi:LOW QUALITY PROTEIN: HEAT repeat-containing protein 5B-like [Apodemus sylvaticus]|uniref:LOW QUALITY PROTEIN: HEAT repeat-containing protein 5B-like n=1 Tax=Apodemus sylvaticus TaxID=10129 RepID=UPI00224421C5|nr:LOW QUALITY PROTEIN: HEAT repeat-containing protein 5B-like [Apodemus sylvaticus]
MDLAHSLLLNEEALAQITEAKGPVFIFEWLRFLDKVLVAANKTWSLHSLALRVDSSGPMYRGYLEPTLSLVVSLLLTVPPSHTEVHQCLGRCLGATITTVGPELQGNAVTISTIRSSCLVDCAITQDHSDSLLQAAAISCLQELHMFAPRHVNLSSLVPSLCVYVVAMNIKKEAESKPKGAMKNTDDDDDDYGGIDELPPDSLITLVQPELPTLSRLWLAALRDYALLTSPAEFSSQLPADGGAFYTPETIDTARLHYRNSWAPILHAVALWLNSTGFICQECTEATTESGVQKRSPAVSLKQVPGAMASAEALPEVNKDRMHLTLGVSIQFLCSPRPEEPIEHVTACLQALHTLLGSPYARIHIVEDQLIGVELLSVLHHLLLTWNPPAIHLLVTGVVQQIVRAAQDYGQEKRSALNEEDVEKESCPTLGEGGDTGGLIPGKSLVFATMELMMFILVRHMPHLSTKMLDSPSHMVTKTQLSEESTRLVAATVAILSDLPSLCSPAGCMTILPTILFLIARILKDTAIKSADNQVPAPVSAALQGIKSIVTLSMAKTEETQRQWTALIRSTLACILEYSQPDDCMPAPDEASMLTAIVLFLWSASSEIIGVQSLQNGCVNRFKSALNSCDPWVQAKCYQLLLSVFQHSNRALSTPYIHSLAPLVVAKLKAVEKNRPASSTELLAVQEGIKVLETLVVLGEEQNRVQLLALLVPTLISYLLDESSFASASPISKDLHEFALQNLMHIGPLYPHAFKTVMGAAPELKARLETAVRASQASKAKAAARQPAPITHSAPTIKLKTSFLYCAFPFICIYFFLKHLPCYRLILTCT